MRRATAAWIALGAIASGAAAGAATSHIFMAQPYNIVVPDARLDAIEANLGKLAQQQAALGKQLDTLQAAAVNNGLQATLARRAAAAANAGAVTAKRQADLAHNRAIKASLDAEDASIQASEACQRMHTIC